MSQFLEAPRVPHWDVICIVCHLKRGLHLGILYKRYEHNKVEGFANTDVLMDPNKKLLKDEGWLFENPDSCKAELSNDYHTRHILCSQCSELIFEGF